MHSWKPLEAGDKVAVLSPASFPEDEWFQECMMTISAWDLQPVPGRHVLDRYGFMAGRDSERLQDLNAAIRDPGIRAIVTTRGGAGAYRIMRGVDTEALILDSKPLVGFSDITSLHLVWQCTARIASIHGSTAGATALGVRDMLFNPGAIRVTDADAGMCGYECTTTGRASGPLLGGHLENIARAVGTIPMSFNGGIFFFEAPRTIGIGNIDRQLTQLVLSGVLDGITGVAIGGLDGFEGYVDREWSVIDVLRDRLSPLGVPILGGIPAGHLPDATPLMLGAQTVIDADACQLTQMGPNPASPKV
jgi:muramoyltetrapeptide carboxypeptidase